MAVSVCSSVPHHRQFFPVPSREARTRRAGRASWSQINRNPRSTSALGYFTPWKVSSQMSSATCFASFTPSAFASRTRCRPFRSSRARRASWRRSMFSDVTSSSDLSARVSDRTNELNTSSSRDRGADHGCDLSTAPIGTNAVADTGDQRPRPRDRPRAERNQNRASVRQRYHTREDGFPHLAVQREYAEHAHHQQHARLLVICSIQHERDVSGARSDGRHDPWERAVAPVPKLGPPLNARPDQRWPWTTPARTSSRNKYNESWNLSFTRAGRSAVYIARAKGECVWVFNRNLSNPIVRSVRC
ncbi:hypothetical protein C8Q80DRAFT_169445 [Daedaleopsis nitida]|nr:hypothetical protein C8Q80DRAFT_169445 [Daedaleopsis nitida]